jgi:hypothetical protein
VTTVPLNPRPTAVDLWGDGTPAHLGMTLDQFVASTRVQADWFVEASLSDGDRDDAWALLRRTSQGSNFLAGTGDLRLAELRTASPADWVGLAAFGRGCDSATDTVRILNRAAYTLPQRVALGTTLLALEAIIPPVVLRLTVSELQLSDVQAAALIPAINAYWTTYSPHLQRRYSPAPGARGLEFQAIIDLLSGVGIAPFATLHGRIRNLHRFSVAMLNRLVTNWADTSRSLPVHLVLHTSHDESSFQESAGLFEDLVLNSPNLVLFLEGQDHLADITALIPAIAATYGQPDAGGTPRIAQAMIAGHGQARSVQLAGTGVPGVRDENVEYPSESLDLDNNLVNTQALLDTLLTNLDPATAHVVFAGCLVGANPVPLGTPTAGMAGQIAATPSLATFTQQRATAAGLGAGVVQGARASVALGAASSLHDGAGNLAIQYAFDPDAFGTALAYLATGHEPEGEMRAAVEVAAISGPIPAENALRTRQAAGVDPGHDWYDEMTMVLVNMALDGVAVGAGVDPQRLNILASMAEAPFLSRWPGSFAINVQSFVSDVNSQAAFATDLYTAVAATPTFTAASDADSQAMRLIIEQARIANGEAREAALLAFIDANAAITADVISNNLDAAAIAASSATFFPAAAPVTAGRIRLALAWLDQVHGNPDVRAFLNAQVVTPAGAAPELSAAVKAELGGFQETTVLETLGRLLPGGPGAPPDANAELVHTGDNRVLIEPHPYEATVLAAGLNVRDRPHMGGSPFAVVHAGDVVSVAGFTHNWAGIDLDGTLGFVHRNFITAP